MMADWLHPALRFAHYGVLLGLFGTIAFRVFGLRSLASETGLVRMPEISLVIAAIAAPVVSLALMLVGIAAMMGQPVWDLEGSTVSSIVTMTDMGWAFVARMVLLVAGLAAWVLIKPTALRNIVAASCYGLAVLTLAWSGHAAATEGSLGLVHRLNDGVHLVAAGLWIGAIGWFTALVVDAHKNPDRRTSALLRDALEGFAPLGITLVAIVAVTGGLNAQLVFGLQNSVDVLGTTYGWLLTGKVLMVALMVMCAARNKHLAKHSGAATAAASVSAGTHVTLGALRSSLAIELLLTICVLATVALAGLASPMTEAGVFG